MYIKDEGHKCNQIIVYGRSIEREQYKKIFCDIPAHKLTENISLKGIGQAFEELS